MDLKSASELIQKLPFDTTVKYKFINDLSDGLFEKHRSFLSNPLLLSIMLLTYNENAEIPSKLSIFYNQAYEALFQRHDANKSGYKRDRQTDLDIQDFAKVFSLFSLQTYEKRIFKMQRTECLSYITKSRDYLKKKFKPEEYLADLLTAACLLIEDGLDIAYSHRSFQEYFVALHISQAIPPVQESLINRYWKNVVSDNVMNLLSEINPDLVERVLIIPKLDEIFHELGVKKKVGVMHATKYIKKVYTNFFVDQGNLAAVVSTKHTDIYKIVRLAVQLDGSYSFPAKSYLDKSTKAIHAKYGARETKVSYSTKNLSYKSPFMVDVLNTYGTFSLAYLQAAYGTLCRLKLKHCNPVSDLEELLEI